MALESRDPEREGSRRLDREGTAELDREGSSGLDREGAKGAQPEDLPDEPGAEGGSKSPAADTPPAFPSKDDSELGDTDQHSTG